MVIGVGIVGTGFAATKRAEAVAAGCPAGTEAVRSHLVAVAGEAERARAIALPYGADALSDWRQLVADDRIDLVVVATVNARHGAVVEAALRAGRHVVVEYPLALDLSQAQALVTLARERQRLLHIEHIELLGGLHQTAKAHLAMVGPPTFARYTTLAPQHPAPQKWSYRLDLSGFPLVSALSRVSRLVDLFGSVTAVSCHSQFDPAPVPYYRACLCEATLQFASGVKAELVYGKGERDWVRTRRLEIVGPGGQMIFEGDRGRFQPTAPGPILDPTGHEQVGREQPISVAPRRGLFQQDTAQVMAHLLHGDPLQPPSANSLYALTVADALRRSAATETPVVLPVR
ncbi:MAG: Gfo/Idh/MocA family oxidoreductase [Cyanobacteria bacterium P01_A01_bin.105]